MPRRNRTTGLVAPYGQPWYDATRTILQDCSSGVCNVSLSDGTRERDVAVQGLSANECAFWAGQVSLGPGRVGPVIDQDDRTFNLAGLGSMGPDGALALKVLRDSYGPWDVIERDNTRWRLTEGDAYEIQLLGDGRALWWESGLGLLTRGVDFVEPLGEHWGGLFGILCSDGKWRLLYQSYDHGAAVFDGHIIARGANFYDLGVIEKPVGTFVFDWSLRDGDGDPRSLTLTYEQLATLPDITDEIASVDFTFDHEVLIAPFKDPHGVSLAPAEIVVNQTKQDLIRPCFAAGDSLAGVQGSLLGIYSEASLAPASGLEQAARLGTRLLLCHDKPGGWTLPVGLRICDLPAIEFYLDIRGPDDPASETVVQSAYRWRSNLQSLLFQWPLFIAVVPMFYCMSRPDGSELWPVATVLEGLKYLSALVNSSSRIKVIAPFSYQRANGIVGHLEFQQTFKNLLKASPGIPTLLPVAVPKPDPIPPQPKPKPIPPTPKSPFLHHKGAQMEIDGKIITMRAFKGMLLRPDAPNTGIWAAAQPPGWRGGLCDKADRGDEITHHRAAKLSNGRYTFTHVQNNGLAGEDAGEFTPNINQQFYYKPNSNTEAGELEQWRVYDGNENGAIMAVCEHKTSDTHPSGPGHPFWAYPVAIEVVG